MWNPYKYLLGVVALLLLPGMVWAQTRLELPEQVFPGQPFMARIVTDAPVGDVLVEWNGKSIPVPMREIRPAVQPGQTNAPEPPDSPDSSVSPGSPGSPNSPGQGGEWRGEVLLGVPYEQKGDSLSVRVTTVSPAGHNVYERELTLRERVYPEQHLTVKNKYVDVARENLDRHAQERKRVVAALGSMRAERLWSVPFLRPVSGSVSSEYGLTRFFNGKPRNPHKGLDLRGAAGTPIRACADGIVALAEEHFFAGNSVYLDHGQGVVTMYFHMRDIAVKPGQTVRRGDVLGTVGSTGRVTGPHLHWGLAVQGELVDPSPLLADR